MSSWVRQPTDEPLVVSCRGMLAENTHRGRICVVSADSGQAVRVCGDADGPVYVRSTAKPLQAIAPLLGGVAEACGWQSRHLAMLGASQRGLPEQMDALDEMLASSGVPEDAFAFGPSAPVDSRAREAWARAGGGRRKLYHTCAGKHLGMLAWCRLQGWPLAGYIEPDHPAQREILRRVREWAGSADPDGDRGDRSGIVGRDGCGLPVAAIPLRHLALAYARLASPDAASAAGIEDGAVRSAARVAAAMEAHPELVEGPGRLASLLLADGNVVAKSGAQGVFAFGLRRERLGVAIQASDGTEIAWAPIVIAVLEELGGVSPETLARLRAHYPQEYRNDAGDLAGERVAVFRQRWN